MNILTCYKEYLKYANIQVAAESFLIGEKKMNL